MAEAHAFGRYRVTGTLGSGAMGHVYAAVDEVLGRDVAIKTFREQRSGLAARMFDERFRQEARAIAAFTHPNVVAVFDIDLAAEPPYLVMERVAGPSLKERLATGRLPEPELRALGIQIARALAVAHATGIVHRDVKPANILAAGGGLWKLADFGVAHVPDSSITMTGQFVGSPAYAPPEALVRGECSAAGDVFGLGATLYEAAAGSWPRTDQTSGALLAPIPSLATLAPALPGDLVAIIDRAVAFDAARRPTAAELADALAAVHAIPVAPPPPPLRAVPLRWKPWAIGAGVAILVIAIAAGRSSSPAAPAADLAPATIRVRAPSGLDGHAAKDWNKIVDELYRGHYEGARRKLDEFEDRYGETDETRELRPQLDALGPDPPRRGKRDDD